MNISTKLAFIAWAGLFFHGCQSDKSPLKVYNPLDIQRMDEPIVISREELTNKMGEFPEGMVPLVKNSDGEAVPCQVDDIDGDCKWDELAFICNLQAQEQKLFNIVIVSQDSVPEFTKRTNIRLGVGSEKEGFKGVDHAFSPKGFAGKPIKYQAESVSWENDYIAFRDYFDVRNAKDLFGKTTHEMVMDNVGSPESGSYHELSSWGMDILHVGPSLGSGGLAMFYKDSLYRLAATDVFEFKVVSRGPIRSIFELNFEGWHVEGEVLAAQERITIWAGKHWFKSDVTISGFQDQRELATGIVTSDLKNNEPFQLEAGENYTLVGTHDVQSLNEDMLGMGILLNSSQVVRIADAPHQKVIKLGEPGYAESRYIKSVGETHFVTQAITSGVPVSHYFFAVWEEENVKWREQAHFEELMSQEADRLSTPVVVTLN